MDISFETNIREWTAWMTDLERNQLPFATALALTNTANGLREYHRDLLPIIFDRPTRFTMNSLRVTPATKASPVASVWFKDSARAQSHYLLPQVEGGGRPLKRFEKWLVNRGLMSASERAVPAKGLRLDAYGNISAGTITQILSQLAASPDAHQWETARSRKRAGPQRARYFVPRQPGLPRGVWRRQGKKLEPVLIFVSTVSYQARYHFFDLSNAYANAHFPRNFADAMARAIATAR
ncbi:MAG: hypothetical protein BGN87_00205 [Rhizobiales bacterium 65-79]|nr:hypothetical protein [Hyphomicrobiales bacterium]OJU02607.1 MAG: hypothetical protein BGN87_00205 [Rhizobiales bacterium 65-79]